jgi:ATP-dependent Clp protease adaptor protein ClpS
MMRLGVGPLTQPELSLATGLLPSREPRRFLAGVRHTKRSTWCSAADGGVLDRPTLPGLKPRKNRQKKRPPIYKVLLHNDDYNKREYVVQVLLKVVDGFSVEDALNVMQEAHQYGLALVTECSQDRAEEICENIRRSGLISTIEPAS